MATKPRILFLDIETAPNVGYFWGLLDQNISHDQVENNSYVLCWAAQWYGQHRVLFDSVQRSSRKQMLKRIHALLNQADLVIHFYGSHFDIPTLNREFVIHRMRPPSPYKQLDLCLVSRRLFRTESHKLDALLARFGLARKLEHRGFKLWVGCMRGDKGCWREMTLYNKQDCRSMVPFYRLLLPWIEKHPTLAERGDKPACPNCGSLQVQQRGTQIALSRQRSRYQCQACGKWFTGEIIKPAKPKRAAS